MKKVIDLFLLSVSIVSTALIASEPIGIETLFNKQLGLRTLTQIQILNTGNSSTYTLSPTLSLQNSEEALNDTKQIFLQQSFMYSPLPELDFSLALGGNYTYQDISTQNQHHTKSFHDFSHASLGMTYIAASILNFSPQLDIQTTLLQKQRFGNEQKNFYFSTYMANLSFKTYSDPVVYSIYMNYLHHTQRKFKNQSIQYGDVFGFGLDLSIALSPKVSFDISLGQSYQNKTLMNSEVINGIYAMPSLMLGSTYSFNFNTAISIMAQTGGSAHSPDSIFGISLWKKF